MKSSDWILSDTAEWSENKTGVMVHSFTCVSPCVNSQASEYPLSVNANESEFSKIGESGIQNITNLKKSPVV